ncbi:MAG: hypothetical protein RLZZ67_634 [Candidatus Parcubacteria bacterium]|jgi:hypothetical protein
MNPTTQLVLPHLNNGVPPEKRDLFHYEGVPMCFFLGRRDLIVAHVTRFAPFFRISESKIIGLDWKFYIQASDEDREALLMVLWAAGILTTNKLNTFVIRPEDQEDLHFGPTVWGRKLFFAQDRLDEAQFFAYTVLPEAVNLEYAEFREIAGSMAQKAPPPQHVALGIFQCTELARFVEIRSPVPA